MDNSQPQTSTSDQVAAQSYKDTLERLKTEFADDPKSLEALASLESADDVKASLEHLKKTYQDGRASHQKTTKWLHKISTRLMYYEKVIDTIAQHHAEYVSLVWGSIKFILVGIINYAELVEEFGVAWIEIGDILHDIKLDVHLHDTTRILHLYSEMYAHITEFLFRAIRWYKRSTTKRALQAIVNPWQLKYKDILLKIQSCSKTITYLSSAESRLEVRQINQHVAALRTQQESLETVIKDIQRRLGVKEAVMDTVLKTVTANKSISERVNNHIEEIKPSIYAIEVKLQGLLEGVVDPNIGLQKAQAVALRRRHSSLSQPSIRLVSLLSRWISASNQSLLILQSSARARDVAKDLSINTLAELQKADYKVLWAYQQPTSGNASDSSASVLKSLIYQIATCNPQTTFDFPRPLRTSQEGSSCTLPELQDLLGILLCKFGRCFIIVETQHSRDPEFETQIVQCLEKLIQFVTQNVGPTIKVIVLGSNGLDMHGRDNGRGAFSDKHAVVTRVQRPQPVPARLRNVKRRPNMVPIVRRVG
ncbi:hypothetical protein F4860DRAFT_524408 [Xylaria cubensis]|nr:hypothetical protein F4860DRAFT_524408 [Xylaria cubensis]